MNKIIFLICLWMVITIVTLTLRKFLGQAITKKWFIPYCIATIIGLIIAYFRLD